MSDERCVGCGKPASSWPTPVRCTCGCPYASTEGVDPEVTRVELCPSCGLRGQCAALRAEQDEALFGGSHA